MTLTNPTDDQLNAAFAERVCGWVWTKIREARRINGDLVEPELFVWCRQNGEFAGNPWQHDFTRSADAVLPWLEKCASWERKDGQVWVGKETDHNQVGAGSIIDGEYDNFSFPRAAVIALLRAHGVEVEFDK